MSSLNGEHSVDTMSKRISSEICSWKLKMSLSSGGRPKMISLTREDTWKWLIAIFMTTGSVSDKAEVSEAYTRIATKSSVMATRNTM